MGVGENRRKLVVQPTRLRVATADACMNLNGTNLGRNSLPERWQSTSLDKLVFSPRKRGRSKTCMFPLLPKHTVSRASVTVLHEITLVLLVKL